MKQIQKTVKRSSHKLPFKIGDKIFVHANKVYLGRLRTIDQDFFVLDNVSWISMNTWNFHDSLVRGILKEVEPFPSWIFIGRKKVKYIVPWNHDLPRVRKGVGKT